MFRINSEVEFKKANFRKEVGLFLSKFLHNISFFNKLNGGIVGRSVVKCILRAEALPIEQGNLSVFTYYEDFI